MPALRIVSSIAAALAFLPQAATASAAHRPAKPELSGANLHGDCPTEPHTVSRSRNNVYFTYRGSLYGCDNYGDSVYGNPRHDVARLGPWTGHHLATFGKGRSTSTFVAWTIRTKGADGQLTDTVHAGISGYGPRGPSPAVPLGPTAATDRLVTKLVVKSNAAAWVTDGGAVVLFLFYANEGNEPALIGANSPAAAPPATATPADALGLLSPTPVQDHTTALIGRWPSVAPAALGASLKLTYFDDEPDICHDTQIWTATVQPDSSQPRVGVSWSRTDPIECD